jgi:hypothetical protein
MWGDGTPMGSATCSRRPAQMGATNLGATKPRRPVLRTQARAEPATLAHASAGTRAGRPTYC